MAVDLQRATLIDFRLSGCEVLNADFSHARFVGAVHIRESTFAAKAGFYGAEFTALANFDGTVFEEGAFFSWSHFHGAARFARVRSAGGMRFHHTRFDAEAVFEGGKHADPLDFSEVESVRPISDNMDAGAGH